ncbi:GNAT family N-acetyltransferase [Legionella worsleiensis]|uniref:GNAT family acetyltransferase n=1 Tax=Legionella worsleiensis TaxID=45076 RepID=A0A0W1A6C3_9GAMM|nr:GNAT family N-acetyltransferase [Legionella worsleiensis]KTD76895.1 GNAT family acetyltransferase [Legionella worsleiensis]STY33435.1 acyltransferase [Legionella worsleiensis]
MIHFNWYKFSELTVEQLYAVLALRADVFVVEQNGAYLDPDGKDAVALHLLGMKNDQLVAYLRLFPPNSIENYIVFGRVATGRTVRAKGYGKKLIGELLAYCDINFPGISIQCSARAYLKQFYENFGFKVHGEIYEEDGFPHLAMQIDK